MSKIWAAVILFRLINSCIRDSFWYFDEINNSLEPAHFFTFGYGVRDSSWHNKNPDFVVMNHRVGNYYYGIHAGYFPLIYSIVFYVLKILHLDDFVLLMVYLPRVVNGLFAVLMDYSMYRHALARLDLDGEEKKKRAKFALLFSLFCSANIFLGVRFFTNSFETVLTVIAMWMWAEFERRMRIYDGKIVWPLILFVWIILFAFFLRMSNALFWVSYFFLFFVHDGLKWRRFSFEYFFLRLKLLFSLKVWNYVLLIGSVILVVGIQIGADFFVYGELVFPVYRNFMFNIFEGNSIWFGVEKWDFYVLRTIPFFLQGFLIPIFVGLLTDVESLKEFFIFFVSITAFVKVPHKEIRFVYPTVPFVLCIAERGYHNMWPKHPKIRKIFFVFCCVLHVTVGWIYLRDVKEIGVCEAMRDVRKLILQNETVVLLYVHNSVGTDSYIHRMKKNWDTPSFPKLRRNKNYFPEYILIPGDFHKRKLMREISRFQGAYSTEKSYTRGAFDQSRVMELLRRKHEKVVNTTLPTQLLSSIETKTHQKLRHNKLKAEE